MAWKFPVSTNYMALSPIQPRSQALASRSHAFCVKAWLRVVSSPDPTHYAGKGLVTFEGFLGCAYSAIM